jgi:hypothetical protein
MMGQTTGILEDTKVNVKFKIAALWATVMFLFAYGDIFGYFRPGFIGEIMAGNVAGNVIDQGFLLFTTAYVTIPSLMVFLSLVLKPNINRPANIALGIVYAASILLFCIGESYVYYLVLSVLECVLLLLVAWYAWKWPKQA